jgi:hypothetical protein
VTGAAFERCGSPDLVYGANIVGRPETGPFPLILSGAAIGGRLADGESWIRTASSAREEFRFYPVRNTGFESISLRQR